MSDPIDDIDALIGERERWSDEDVLAELATFPPLPPEEAFYGDDAIAEAAWKRAAHFTALASLCAMRKLRKGAILLLERASEGDPGETMRGLRHALEAIFDPDWNALTAICVEAMSSPRRGARLWAADELGRLRDPVGLPALLGALDDPRPYDRTKATLLGTVCNSIERICMEHPRLGPQATSALRHRAEKEPVESTFIERIQEFEESYRLKELVRDLESHTDAEVLAELEALEPLPQESAFNGEGPEAMAAREALWRFRALAASCACRKIRPAATLLLARASEGDPKKTMRSLGTTLEAIFGADRHALVAVCVEALQSPRAGTQMWAADALGTSMEIVALPALLAALDRPDPYGPVRATVMGNVCWAIHAICIRHPTFVPAAVAALERRAARSPDGDSFAKEAAFIEQSAAPPDDS